MKYHKILTKSITSLKIKSFRNICDICEFQQIKQPKQDLVEETNDIYNH